MNEWVRTKEFRSLEDIDLLIDAKMQEGLDVEYKSELHLNSDSEKKEFLYDAVSFINSDGGHIFFGIDESKGVPTNINPIHIDDTDTFKAKIDQILRTGIEPRYSAFEITFISASENKFIIELALNKSYHGPHRASYQSHHRFYQRSSIGKVELGILELKQKFLEMNLIRDQIKNKAKKRIEEIRNGSVPAHIEHTKPLFVLQMFPIDIFDFNANKLKQYKDGSLETKLYVLGTKQGVSFKRYNFDGLLAQYPDEGGVGAYTQLYRSGQIEAVIRCDYQKSEDTTEKFINPRYEFAVVESLSDYFKILIDIGANYPIALNVSLINASSYFMYLNETQSFYQFQGSKQIQGNELATDFIEITDEPENVDVLLKPLFDQIWNSAGFERSLNYDNSGRLPQ